MSGSGAKVCPICDIPYYITEQTCKVKQCGVTLEWEQGRTPSANIAQLVKDRETELEALAEKQLLGDRDHPVMTWRFEQFRSVIGEVDAEVVWVLAESQVDVELARKLHRLGCSPEIALRILI